MQAGWAEVRRRPRSARVVGASVAGQLGGRTQVRASGPAAAVAGFPTAMSTPEWWVQPRTARRATNAVSAQTVSRTPCRVKRPRGSQEQQNWSCAKRLAITRTAAPRRTRLLGADVRLLPRWPLASSQRRLRLVLRAFHCECPGQLHQVLHRRCGIRLAQGFHHLRTRRLVACSCQPVRSTSFSRTKYTRVGKTVRYTSGRARRGEIGADVFLSFGTRNGSA